MMGKGGGSGPWMMRGIGRTVARVGNGFQDRFTSSSSTVSPSNRQGTNSSNCLAISSPIISGAPFQCSHPEIDDWVAVNGYIDECFTGSYPSSHVSDSDSGSCVSVSFYASQVLGNVPSEEEVDATVTSLLDVFGSKSHKQPSYDSPSSVSGSETDWKEPYQYDTRIQEHGRYAAVYQAFNLLENDESVQRMVKSMATDKSIWDACLNNKVLRELKEESMMTVNTSASASNSASSSGSVSGDKDSNEDKDWNIVIRILNSSRVKFMELIQKITNIFQPKIHNKNGELVEFSDDLAQKIKTSVMLTILVYLVVMVDRARKKA